MSTVPLFVAGVPATPCPLMHLAWCKTQRRRRRCTGALVRDERGGYTCTRCRRRYSAAEEAWLRARLVAPKAVAA